MSAVLYDHGNNAASSNPLIQPRGNGNIADDGLRLLQYDAFNRLIQVKRKSDAAVIATYGYDALGRRVQKIVNHGGLAGSLPNSTYSYSYDQAQCVQEYCSIGVTTQYVWGKYIDELIQLQTDGYSGPQSLPPGNYYLLSDLLYRSIALTDNSGNIVEAYDTDVYGNTRIYQDPGPDNTWFTNDDQLATYPACRFIFTGREFDAESQLYFGSSD